MCREDTLIILLGWKKTTCAALPYTYTPALDKEMLAWEKAQDIKIKFGNHLIIYLFSVSRDMLIKITEALLDPHFCGIDNL